MLKFLEERAWDKSCQVIFNISMFVQAVKVSIAHSPFHTFSINFGPSPDLSSYCSGCQLISFYNVVITFRFYWDQAKLVQY